jgi:hypothetical protein
MNIPGGPTLDNLVEPPANAAAQPLATPATTEAALSTSSSAGEVGQNAASETAAPAKPGEPLTDVSLRLDNNGRVYYVVSDANSGQEILEVPPKALRDVDQGIADYLKQLQSKATSHVKVTA